MSIAVFSNFVNGIPTTIYDGKDVSMVMLVDPPANLPAFFLAGKGVLDTTSQTIKVYDGTGNTVIHNFDIAGADLEPINQAIAALDGRVSVNESDINTLDGLVAKNITDIGTNTGDVSDLKGRTSDLESTTSSHTTDILGLQASTGSNASDISALSIRVGNNETGIAAVLLTANAADTLSKANAKRLDELPPAPDLSGYIKTGDDANLNSVSFGDNTKIDTQPDLGLVLQGDYIYGKADSGLEHFFVESGNFNIKSKKIQKVNDGQAEDDAVNKRQLSAVESKADSAQSTAIAADTLSKTNQSDISNLSSTVGGNSAQISTNTKDIGDLSTKVDVVETTANAADTLSKANAARLDGLPADVTPRVDALESNALQKDANGYDAKSFKVLNVASGEDTDSSAANIGDVKRIATTSGGGLKPTDNEWDMLTYPIINIGTSTISSSAATVGQVNAVDSKADQNAGDISNLGTTVGQHDSQISINTSDIATVTSTANAADTLSKANATRIDNLPPSPDLSGYAKLGTDVNFTKVNATDLDFTGKSATAEITHDHNIDVKVQGTANVAFKSNGMKLLSPIDGHGQALNSLGDIHLNSGKKIFGSATGALELRNLGSIKRNNSNDSNSVTLGEGFINYKGNTHFFYNNDGTSLAHLSANTLDIKSKKLTGVSSATVAADAVNLSQSKIGVQSNTVNVGGLSQLNVDGQTLEHWMNTMQRTDSHTFYNRVRRARPVNTTGGVQENWIAHYAFDQDSNIYNFLPDSVPKSSGHMQILHEGDIKTRWVIWLADTYLLSKSLTFNIGTGASGQPNTAFGVFEAGGGGNNPSEVDGFKKYISTASATTYYEHQGNSHLYIDWTGNGGTISLDTMRSGTEQQEDVFMLHNKTDTDMSVRFFFNGSSVTQIVTARSFVQGWANRDIGKWVLGVYKDPSFVPEQLVIKSDDLSWSTSSDPRTNTKRMIEAAPVMCTIIGRHISNGSAKQKIVSVGDTSRLESQTSTFVINKHSSTHATGICTSEESSGKTWSRILDGKRGAWFTNESANSRMVSGDIDPTEYPEEQIFFTTDQGIMETYLDESVEGEVGIIKLRPLSGYNVPKNEADIAALEVQTEKNRSVTHYFINEGSLSYDWPDEDRRPLVEVQVLNTMQNINNSSVTVTDNDTHRYSATYNTVGAVAINSSGNWSVQYVYHNAYKHPSEDWYVVFNQSNSSWQIIEAANPHTSVGTQAAFVTVQLGGQTSLPASFGNYTIDPNFDNIDSLEFITAEVPVQYDDINSRILINFNGAKPSGYVVLK